VSWILFYISAVSIGCVYHILFDVSMGGVIVGDIMSSDVSCRFIFDDSYSFIFDEYHRN
jgi:hypothetical protein